MKKLMFVFMVLLLLAGTVVASYTVSGKVYQKGTTIVVPNASVTLSSSSGLQSSVFSDATGSYSVYWGGSTVNEINNSMTLTASKNFATGQKIWTASQSSETKNVEIATTIELDPSIQIQTIPARWTGAGPTTMVSQAMIQGTAGPVMVQNAQINLAFNGPGVNVVGVAPTMPGIEAFLTPLGPGEAMIEVFAFGPPMMIPGQDFPPESFFDIFVEVDIPEDDVELVRISIGERTEFFDDRGGVLGAIPSLTENIVGEKLQCSPYLMIDEQGEWVDALGGDFPDPEIVPMSPAEWNDPTDGYMKQWSDWLEEGQPYDPLPEARFLPPELYVYPGDDDPASPYPDDAGLVMVWGDGENGMAEGGEYASAWKYSYGIDPDLTNCIIKVTATPPPGITNISLGLQDINGNIRSWHWTCGPGGVLPNGVPTTIRIDTSMFGLAAANPMASGYANNPNFDLTQVQYIIADENGIWVAQQQTPPPGGQTPRIWNYWHNLSVHKKPTKAYKGNYVKFSQPPVEQDGLIDGWDVQSVFPHNFDQGMTWTWAADDWRCHDKRPITDIHWWGSFIGWQHQHLPPQVPDYFIMAIWRDVPANADAASHPKELLWTHKCYKWVWNYAGDDRDPRSKYIDPTTGEQLYDSDLLGTPQENEACFQFNQLLSEDEWFYQEPMQTLPDGTTVPNVYWFSIAAVYEGVNISDIKYPWGWKTKPFDPDKAPDAAVVIKQLDDATPPFETVSGTVTGNITEVTSWYPLLLPYPNQYPEGQWFDLAFELTTNEPKCPGLKADLNNDCIVNLPDFAIMAQEWLTTSP